jgi:hypothetical protein
VVEVELLIEVLVVVLVVSLIDHHFQSLLLLIL